MTLTSKSDSSGSVRGGIVEGLRGENTLSASLISLCARPVATWDLDQAARLLHDWCGVAIAAMTEPSARAAQKWASTAHSDGTCTTFGSGLLPPESAAFVNGSLGTLLEMDDLHRASILHAGDVVIPAALAAAQYSSASPRRLLEAILAGYEVALRIGEAAAGAGYTGWYNSGTCGIFGAAMAAAHAAGASDQAKLDALGQAGMQSAGMWQCRLETTDSKALATAHTARAGITSAYLALHGYRGPREILEGRLGFFALHYPQANPERVLDMPAQSWKVHEVSFKPWPACRHVHPAIGLALNLKQKIELSQLESITVHSYSAAIEFCDKPAPKTPTEARFSLQHCIACALARGGLNLSDLEIPALDNDMISQLRKLVRLVEDPQLTEAFPNRMGARLEVETRSAAALELATEHAPGDPESPLGPAQLADKFRANLAWVGIADADAEELSAAICELPRSSTLERFDTALHPMTVLNAKASRIGAEDV